MIGTVSFDGLSQGSIWTGRAASRPHLQQRFINLGFTGEVALEITFTHRPADDGRPHQRPLSASGVIGHAHGRARATTPTELSRRFVHSLIPIALAYVVAHYFSLLIYQGQAMAYLVSDPLGDGSDLFGTARPTIDYNLVGANGVWYVQVFALVARPRGRPDARARPRARRLRPAARRDALAVLDACGHGRLHQPRPLAPLGRGAMIELPLAHAGHWYHALLYLAPVLIVVVVLWVQERRERRRDPDAEVDRRDLDLE